VWLGFYPDQIAERAQFMQHEGAKSWDKLLTPLLGLGGALVLVVAGLDARYGWPPDLSILFEVLALIVGLYCIILL